MWSQLNNSIGFVLSNNYILGAYFNENYTAWSSRCYLSENYWFFSIGASRPVPLLVDDDLSDIEKLENQELNEIADTRLNDDQAFISVSL